MTSVQERIKKLNQLDSGTKAPLPQHHRDIKNLRAEPHTIPSNDKPYKPVAAQSTNKAHLFKTAKLIKKSFSTDDSEGDAPFLSSPKKQQKHISESKSSPSDDRIQSHASLSDDDNDDELDAAAAMSYWRSRAKGKQSSVRKEAISEISTTNTSNSNEVSGASSTEIKPNIQAKQINNITPLTETDPVVLPHSPPRLQHRQSPQSNFQEDIFGSTNTQIISKGEEESSIDINTATSASPKSSTNHKYALSPTRQLLSVKSSESVLSAATETSSASTLSTRAKKFLKEKRKNGPILTGRVNAKTNILTKGAKQQNITHEQASKDRLKKKLAALSTPVAVGETTDPIKYPRPFPHASNSGELGRPITQQTKADIPFDEPTGDATNDNCWDNTSKSSQKSDIIHVTQQYNVDHDGSLSEVTNQSEMNSTTTDSLVSDRGRRTTHQQKKSPKTKSSIPHNEGVGESILDTFGALAEDAGCQVLDVFESFANALKATYEEDNGPNRNVATTDAPFDEDVAIEVEYVEKM